MRLDPRSFPFQSRWITLGAGRVHYVDEGRGDPILFVHGTPTWSFEYRHLIQALSADNRCIAPDHLGFGLSERPTDFAYTPEAHAAVLDEFVRALDLQQLTLVVHDFGGPIGLPIALDRPERVRRLVLLNTWLWPFDDDPGMLRKARLVGGPVGRWLYRHLNFSLRVLMPGAYGRRAALTPDIHRQYLEVFRDKNARVHVLHALARALTGSRDFYARLWDRAGELSRSPVLLVWGLADPAFGPAVLNRWRQRLPHASVVELEGVGHWPHEEDPARVVGAIRQFLRPPV